MTKPVDLLPLKWRLFVMDYGTVIFIAAFSIAAVLTYFFLFAPGSHRHMEYLPVETLSTFDSSTDAGFSFNAIVRLPDGTQTSVSTGSLAQAQWFIGDTCVEKRLRDNGRIFYRLAAPSNCLP